MKKIVFLGRLAFAFCMLFLTTSSCFAIEEEIVLNENSCPMMFGNVKENEIYSMSNYSEDLHTSGASVDVVTRKDIENQANPTLIEILQQQAGVSVQTSNGSAGAVSSVRMRGTDRVKFTIDGIRADRASLTAPGFEPQFYESDDIERVEIIRGPQGNVGGSNASGGMIALQTRRGKGPLSIEAGSGFGNYGAFKERFAISTGDSKKDYYLGLTYYKTDGGAWLSDIGRLENDAYKNVTLVQNFGFRLLDEKAEIRDIFRFSTANKGIGIGYDNWSYDRYLSPNSYTNNIDIMNVLAFEHHPTEKYSYDAKFGLYHNKSNNFILPDDINSDFTNQSISKISSTRMNLMSQHNYKANDWNTLSLGYNLETEFIDSNDTSTSWGSTTASNFTGHTLQNDVYLNDSINIKDILFIRGGARFLTNSEYGTYVTPNVSAALVLPTFKIEGAKTKFRGSFGQSVNTPTLYQRFARADYGWAQLLPNPSLKAEQLTGWDAGIEQSFFNDKLSFDVGYFNNSYQDYIGYYSDPITWNGTYVNISSAKIHGYEAKLTWKPNAKVKFILNYTNTHSEDETTGEPLAACPENRINGMVYWTINNRINFFTGLEGATEQAMSSVKGAYKSPAYIDAKLGGTIKIYDGKRAQLSLKGVIYNMFNQNICMYRSGNTYYYAPGIHFMVGIFMRYNLGKEDV